MGRGKRTNGGKTQCKRERGRRRKEKKKKKVKQKKQERKRVTAVTVRIWYEGTTHTCPLIYAKI